MMCATRGRGFGLPGGWQQADVPDASDAADWFAGRLPDDWFAGPANVGIAPSTASAATDCLNRFFVMEVFLVERVPLELSRHAQPGVTC